MAKFENNTEWYEKMADFIIGSFWDVWKFKIKNSKNISSIFLAWAPWAGKTEFLDTIFWDLKENFIVIDVDKYRKLFKWYNWKNSNDFQQGSVKVADKILKFCFKKNLNFVFDWTFRNFNKIEQNFWQCKKYNRFSLITLIYQEPRISFYYTFLRKLKKKRNVPINVFVDWFYSSIENTFKATKKFKNLDLMIAHKVYNPLKRDKWTFKIDNKTKNIYDFCDKYRIYYKKWTFLYSKKLEFDIIKYNNILVTEILWEWTRFGKIKVWFYETLYKYF